MQERKLSEAVAVSGQITPADVADIKAAGYRAIVCNRPDGEAPGQPAFAAIEQAAVAAGLEIVWQPIVSGGLTAADGAAFGAHVADLPKPVLAYCRTGTRCTALWAIAEAEKRPATEIVQVAAEAGYDMRGLLPQLEAIRAAQE